MKAQFEVDEVLWSKVRTIAFLNRKTVGDLLDPILRGEFENGFDVGVGGELRKSPVRSPKTPKVKSEGESVVTTGGLVNPSPAAIPVPAKPIVDQKVMSAYVSDVPQWPS